MCVSGIAIVSTGLKVRVCPALPHMMPREDAAVCRASHLASLRARMLRLRCMRADLGGCGERHRDKRASRRDRHRAGDEYFASAMARRPATNRNKHCARHQRRLAGVFGLYDFQAVLDILAASASAAPFNRKIASALRGGMVIGGAAKKPANGRTEDEQRQDSQSRRKSGRHTRISGTAALRIPFALKASSAATITEERVV
jgi:hypothetical protein